MLKRYFLSIFCLITSLTQAGVVVLCDLPAKVCITVKKEQTLMAAQVALLNQETSTSYVFEPATFDPHLSLSFISPDRLSVDQTCAQYPELVADLQALAKNFNTIDIQANLAQAKIDYWQGKFAINCAGSKKQNYVNIVLKLSDNSELIALANQVQDLLKTKYGIEQRFSFSAHVTLGRICDQNDQAFASTSIANYMSKFDHKINIKKSLQINNFKLKGHDGSQELFMLKK